MPRNNWTKAGWYQSGFHCCRSTADQIFTRQQIFEISYEVYDRVPLKKLGECCGSTVLTAACYCPSSHCIPAQRFVSVSGEFNHNRSQWALNSDMGVCQRCAWTGFWIFGSGLLLPPTRSGVRVFFVMAGTGLDLDFVIAKQTLLVGCLTYVYAESNRSRISRVVLRQDPERIRIDNLQNRIGSGLKISESAHLECVLSLILFIVYMNWTDSHFRVDEGVKVGRCRVNHLVFADDLVLLASSEQGLQQTLDRLSIVCDQVGMKISTEKTEVLCLSRNPRQYMLQVSGNTLQQVETFKYLWVELTSEGKRNMEIDTRIGEANAVLRELYRSVATKRELSNAAKLSVFKSVFVPILTCDHESLIMTERVLSQVQVAETGFCEEFTVWHFTTKCAAVKFAKPWISIHFFESRDPSYVGSAICPECPTKDWRDKS